MSKAFKIDTLSLHECNDGYYIYDYVVGMNISNGLVLTKVLTFVKTMLREGERSDPYRQD